MLRDSEIVRRIREGDVREFESLFRSSYISLVRYARTIVKDQDTAEEIVQDLFFRVWKEKEKFQIESSLNGYLYRAVHNRCLHHIDHLRVVQKYTREMTEQEKETSESPGDILNYRELQGRIAGIIDRLPEKCGKIFCMSRFEGLRYSEIAEKLSISIKTVEANMGRALKEFRKALAEE